MKAAVLPNLDKRGAYDVVLKLGEILKNEEIEAYLPEGMPVPLPDPHTILRCPAVPQAADG